ncbi:MAG: FecR domain-containing protein [Pseudomonadota bacterium]
MADQNRRLIREALKWRAVIDAEYVSDRDRAAFQQWLSEDAAHKAAMIEAERFWDRLGALSEIPLDDVRPNRVALEHAARRQERVRRSRGLMAMGAVASVTILAGAMIYHEVSQPARQLTTQTAEVRTEFLKDGSEVSLDAKSTIHVKIHRWERSAEVLSGSAYFVVKKDTRPFTVTSGSLEIEVTGTQFAVHRSKSGATVSVAEGAVRVNARGDPGEVVTLFEGGRVTSTTSEPLAVSQVAADNVGAWRRNRLVYEEEPIGKLIDDLNRYRDRPIVLTNPSLRSKTITASFDASEVERIPSVLSAMYSLDVVELPGRTELRRQVEGSP